MLQTATKLFETVKATHDQNMRVLLRAGLYIKTCPFPYMVNCNIMSQSWKSRLGSLEPFMVLCSNKYDA